jgi:hypothetical protein
MGNFEELGAMVDLAEDSSYLVGGLLLLSGAFLVALNFTRQNKYLIRAGIAIGLAIAVLAVEWVWVTDNERIEQVVYNLRRAVLNSDAEGVIAHMAPNVQYLQGDTALTEEMTRALIRSNLSHSRFDFLRVADLQVSAGQQSRRGTAEFRVFARGQLDSPSTAGDIGTSVTTWSLGFQETEPGVWKVNRISPISIPRGALALPGGLLPTDGSHLGYDDGIGVFRAKGRVSVPRRGSFRSRGLANASSKSTIAPSDLSEPR